MNLYDVIHQYNYPVGALVIKDINHRLANTASELNIYAHEPGLDNFDEYSHQTFDDVFLKYTHQTKAFLNTLRADRRKKLVDEVKAKITSLSQDYSLPVKQIYDSNGHTVIELW